MRVFQFMSAEHALDNLIKDRLKVSFLEDMNDPFELLGTALASRAHRSAFQAWKRHMNATCRVLCFSRSWTNPVIWSHYADKHRGVCIGFDVSDDNLLEVAYSGARLESQLHQHLQSDGKVTPEFSKKLLTTKYADWRYEDEVRMFVRPDECKEQDGLQFYSFSASLRPRSIVLGAHSSLSERDAKSAALAAGLKLAIIPTRLAFKTFRIIAKPKPLPPARRGLPHGLRM